MKFTITRPVEMEISRIRIDCPYDEDDEVPSYVRENCNNFQCFINLESGVMSYPKNIGPATVHIKAVDRGTYTLIGNDGCYVAELQDYVPHGVVPGSYGDYIELEIDEHNKVTNWPKQIDVSEFFKERLGQ